MDATKDGCRCFDETTAPGPNHQLAKPFDPVAGPCAGTACDDFFRCGLAGHCTYKSSAEKARLLESEADAWTAHKREIIKSTIAFVVNEDTRHWGKLLSPGAPIPAHTPTLRQLTSTERKAIPVHAGVLMYFPDALAAVARVSQAGNDKHNPGEPLHWDRNKSVDQLESLVRHLLTPDAIDADTGETHRTHAAWRALAAVQIAEEKRLRAAGIMPLSGQGA